LTTYSIFDHGSWESYIKPDSFGSIRQIGTGIDWYDYRQNAANFHGGVLVTLMQDYANPDGFLSAAPNTDVSMVSPFGRLIEILDYAGSTPSGPNSDLANAQVVISGNTATFTKPYTLTSRTVVNRMTDAEMYAAYMADQLQPLRSRLTGTAVLLTSFTAQSGTSQFSLIKAAFANLFGAARAETLTAAP
jgi:hypothetical protein